MRTRFIFRTRVLCACFILVAALLVVRLYFVQIVHGADYQQDAAAQYVEANPDTTNRGSIFFTSKNGELISGAVMQTGWRIAIQPKNIKDAASVYGKLNAITPI